ncbi:MULTISPECIES: hypothetical protein [Planktothricoides]|uniref:Uncharacterized protein n=2 Tax=Planktothricoides raciborskii TaxID=132608 RepID=A0AAU8JIM0_9CYAN|nr:MULTISPECIES: hypothetical protein [Planktothricoides]KOR34659.1 hypothetical protein AM228_22840 [Planktothricoides sp. SR001]MBD2546766.1 hypothetical protein [Planktothricoides raciborskii FACHB-1370]MBD2585030.1 hypothetical protein [Planktothricoides raciborskii FACHB-1261]
MADSHHPLTQAYLNFWRFIPYAGFGILAFSLTSATGLSVLLKSYFIILEIPVGLLGIYFLLAKSSKFNKIK